LGQIISEEGIFMDPKKNEAIMNWPTPKNVTYGRYFMGLFGYYKRFINTFSNIAYLVTFFKKRGG
jgi:hypothetical protein